MRKTSFILFVILSLAGIYFIADEESRRIEEVQAENLLETGLAPLGSQPLAEVSVRSGNEVLDPQKKHVARPKNPFPRRIPAPSLDGGEAWLNTSGPISIKDLRGKVVLLDFWTYCCINCMHVLPDLKYLEKKYRKELVVIGVHSAKFDNEKKSENIRQAIMRYEIEHPVINDSKMKVWTKFGARSWPTFALIDPEGFLCGYASGEGLRDVLDTNIKLLIDYHAAKKTLDRAPFHIDLERKKVKPTPLRYPGKIYADEKSNRLFISDSNHNRVVISDLDGRLIGIVGTGTIGHADGKFGNATFDHPHGLTLVGTKLYVADTENHLIRIIDLSAKKVTTLAGTGMQDRRRTRGGKLLSTPLNSPWDIVHVDGVLYIAMAGPHQIWSYELGRDEIHIFAGDGREDIRNGTLRSSEFAQPSGISTDGKNLYVSDSEGSAIRKISLGKNPMVTTLVGPSDLIQGQALFEFGDRDGIGGRARLQHPLHVLFHRGNLYVADTYNHKIKKIQTSQAKAKIVTWLGNGKRGKSLNPVQFSEPEGLAIARGKLYIADTNNHRLCLADLKTGKVSEFSISGLKPPKLKIDTKGNFALLDAERTIAVKSQSHQPSKNLSFEIDLQLADGYRLNSQFPVEYRVTSNTGDELISKKILKKTRKANIENSKIVFEIPSEKKTGKCHVEIHIQYGACLSSKSGLCKLSAVKMTVPIEFRKDGRIGPIKMILNVK